MGIDILGIEILGIDILAPTLSMDPTHDIRNLTNIESAYDNSSSKIQRQSQ